MNPDPPVTRILLSLIAEFSRIPGGMPTDLVADGVRARRWIAPGDPRRPSSRTLSRYGDRILVPDSWHGSFVGADAAHTRSRRARVTARSRWVTDLWCRPVRLPAG